MGIGLSVTVNESPDGRRIVHYDGQSFELTSSSGEVICPAGDGTALHHSRTCTHMVGYEDGWKIYPDPDRELWRRLLEAASAEDVRGRQAFAEGIGLRNGTGRPVSKVCQTCTLVPLPSVSGMTTAAKPLSKALAEFDRAARADQIAEADAEIAQVVRDFPLDAWPTMPLERYALGTDVYQDSFCHRMEFGTDALCSMRGGSAAKHIIFRRKKEGVWRYPSEYDDEQNAWENVRAGLIEAFETIQAGQLSEIDTIASIRPLPALTAKAISCYFPGTLIPVTSRDHVRKLIFHLSGERTHLDAFAAHERLKQCEVAAKNPERPYLLLIDEINRGDIPKILGELITLLEPDKRGMHVTLPSGGRFAVPSNVHILGTMNTADRSIRLLDSALRRRFAFHELLPDTDVLDGQKVGDVDLGLLLRELNRRVVKELGRERQIGHSFFMPGGELVDSESDLAAIVRTEVLPLLQEYAYDDYSMLSRFLGQEIVDVQTHTVAGLSDERLVEALSSELQANAGE
ncbi:McrB family protein [Actinomadura sp. BRA 177]|uniref:McrB family protein n=1 Tax=Actinomadura sp. BRA 177 TaxID=2745202 RepID=UPI0015961BB0|nr:AAA family ATPase [Actinomadura sp. BRA 177]NVI86439.1 AAA family ATPase [Actinomadura sp. BRA 177]